MEGSNESKKVSGELAPEKEVRNRVKQGELPPELKYVTIPSMKDLIQRCLTFDADERPTIEEVKERLLEIQTLSLPPPSLPPPLPAYEMSKAPSLKRSRSYCIVRDCCQYAKEGGALCDCH